MEHNEPVADLKEPRSTSLGTEETIQKREERGKQPKRSSGGEVDLFLLDCLYPEAHKVFQPAATLDPNSDNVVVALDTNALLLPYEIGKGNLSDLGNVYSSIAQAGRLFLPERVAREFIKNRDYTLATAVQAIDDRISRLNNWDTRISSLLFENPTDSELLSTAFKAFDKATENCRTILRGLSDKMKAWRGNDPVTALYASIFEEHLMIKPRETNEDIIKVLDYGQRHNVPPGYKDASKDDRGIGDVVIWLSLLDLGRKTKKDLIFVTGERKADWFVRSNKNPIYPRPELVDEYRRASGGRSLRLSSLHELLKEMKAPDKLVEDVEAAEVTQAPTASEIVAFYGARHQAFDYSTHNGVLHVVDRGYAFDVAFSKRSDTSIYVVKRGNTWRIARVKNLGTGSATSIDKWDSTSDCYSINVGEVFLIQNQTGEVLAGRILAIKDDGRGADSDEVRFAYLVSPHGDHVALP